MATSEEIHERKLTRRQLERQQKLDYIEQLENEGKLRIRKMTDAERERYGPPKNLKKPKGPKIVGSLR